MTRSSAGAGPRAFRTLLTSWGASLTGDGLRIVALPLMAHSIQPTAAAVALVAVAATAPWLLVAAPAGAWVDRRDPARVIRACHLIRCLATAALVALILCGGVSIALLCIFGFTITSAETFADGAAQSLLVDVVPTDQLEKANARFVMVETLALDMAGPLAAGVLFMVAPWLPFALSAVAFALGVLTISRLTGRRRCDRKPSTSPVSAVEATTAAAAAPFPEPVTPAEPIADPGGVRAGLAHLFRSRILRTLVLTVLVMVIANAATDAMLVIYATDSLNLSEALYPTLLAGYSVGTLLAAVLVSRLTSTAPTGSLMLIAMVTIGLTMLAMGLVVHPIMAWIAYTVMGVAGGVWNVLSASRRQRYTPRSMIARVSSAFRVVAWGFIPLGAAAGGVIAQRYGVPMVFAAGGALILILAVVVARSFLRPAVPADQARTG